MRQVVKKGAAVQRVRWREEQGHATCDLQIHLAKDERRARALKRGVRQQHAAVHGVPCSQDAQVAHGRDGAAGIRRTHGSTEAGMVRSDERGVAEGQERGGHRCAWRLRLERRAQSASCEV
jgi:hypothetical protein